jgi:hypothetical protein
MLYISFIVLNVFIILQSYQLNDKRPFQFQIFKNQTILSFN